LKVGQGTAETRKNLRAPQEEMDHWIESVRRCIEEHLSPEERRIFREEFFPEKRLRVGRDGLSNVLVVAPHGFPGDDDHTDYLAFFLAKELRAFYLINNKAFYKPGRNHSFGKPANLNRPWSSNPHTRRFVGLILEMVSVIGSRGAHVPIVLCIHGMSDVNARKFSAGDFCLGAGYTREEKENAFREGGPATASLGLIEGILQGLRRMGYKATDGIPPYCGKRAIPGYLKAMEPVVGRTEAVQVEIRYLGFRDPHNIVKTAREMAQVVRELPSYRRF
jgi:hypothetical protein